MPPEVNLLDIKLEGPQIAVRPYTHTDNYWQVLLRHQLAFIVRVCARKRAGRRHRHCTSSSNSCPEREISESGGRLVASRYSLFVTCR